MKFLIKIIFVFFIFLNTKTFSNTTSDKLYEKIDLFGEVLETIK